MTFSQGNHIPSCMGLKFQQSLWLPPLGHPVSPGSWSRWDPGATQIPILTLLIRESRLEPVRGSHSSAETATRQEPVPCVQRWASDPPCRCQPRSRTGADPAQACVKPSGPAPSRPPWQGPPQTPAPGRELSLRPTSGLSQVKEIILCLRVGPSCSGAPKMPFFYELVAEESNFLF